MNMNESNHSPQFIEKTTFRVCRETYYNKTPNPNDEAHSEGRQSLIEKTKSQPS